MAVSEACTYLPINHPMLRQKAEEVRREEFSSDELKQTIEKLVTIARTERLNGSMVGLAAPQVGISKAIILVDMSIEEKRNPDDFTQDLTVFINPKITFYSKDRVEHREGCYSTGDLYGIVSRPNSIQCEANTPTGDVISMELKGYTARIFQHEVDHLNGIRFPDRVESCAKIHVVFKGEEEEYRKNSDKWTRTCSPKEWHSMIDANSF